MKKKVLAIKVWKRIKWAKEGKRHVPVSKAARKILDDARKHYSNNDKEVRDSLICGCCHCLSTYSPKEIFQWIDHKEMTARCPNCGIDTVLAAASGYPVSDIYFLAAMERYIFGMRDDYDFEETPEPVTYQRYIKGRDF